MSRRIDTVTGQPKWSLLWIPVAWLASWIIVGTAAYLFGQAVRAVLT